MLNLWWSFVEDRETCVMADERTGSSKRNDQQTEPAMVKPSPLWFLVPILIIALAVFLAR
jgi:hypothetical protein